MTNKVKITFTGDIMCDHLEIPAYRAESGKFNFSEIFSNCKDYFSFSDYVVGNLETPIAKSEYGNKIFNYNSPIEFAKAIKDNGFSLVTTANNHCLDRGISGLDDTIKALDDICLKHIGTNSKDEKPTGIIENIGNIKIGFLSYTYGTNAYQNKFYLKKNEKWRVNLYQEQELYNPIYRWIYLSFFFVFIRRVVNYFSRRFFLKRNIFCPAYERIERRKPFIKRMEEDIQVLKSGGAEYIIMCLHSGGQYNAMPIKNTKKIMMQIANMGVDAVIGNHEHVVHYGEKITDKIITYSLGNFTSTIGVHRNPYDKMADYSILFNLYLVKENNITKPVNITFSIAKTISDGVNRVKTVILYDLIKSCTDINERNKLLHDNLKIYNVFRNSNEKEIELKLEYNY